MTRLLASLILLAVMIFGPPAAAAPTHVHVELAAESAHPAPGRPLALALVMRPEPGWHDYWLNPGDTGVKTEVRWSLPSSVKAGGLSFPVPNTLLVAGLMNHVYEGPHALLATAEIAPGTATGTRLPITATVDWLACSATVCVPEHGTFSLDLTVGDGAVAPASAAAFDRYRAAMPRPLGAVAHVARSAGAVRFGIPWPAGTPAGYAHLFPAVEGVMDDAAPQRITRNGDMLVIETKPASYAARPPASFAAVLRTGSGQGFSLSVVPGTVPAAGAAPDRPARASGGAATLFLALGGALLGGLVLNVMPCVFPILSLKALGLARAGGDERAARREALAYAAGAVLACLALGGALLVVRAGGSAVGWAFQLQDAHVMLVLLLLVGAIALNLAGLFELGAVTAGSGLAGQGGVGGAFWTGLLAALVATPCTGPFMAAALGAALALPAAAALAVFGGLGLGLALPFLLIGFVPAIRRMLPRPGAWMERLRRILSVPMFLTAVWLARVLGAEAGVDGMAVGLLALLLLGLALWWTGIRQRAGRGRAWWPALAVLLPVAAATAVLPRAPAVRAVGSAANSAELFSEARLAALRSGGKPVFVYFTADWCLTCKVNERIAIDRAEVAAAFASAHATTLVGDWTRGDPAITRFLQAHGRSGVPFYLFYPAGGGEPKELPQVLTPGLLIALVRPA